MVALSPSLTQKKMAYRLAISRASIFMTRFTNTSWHVRHLLHNESLQRHATGSRDRARIKVNGCLCWWAVVLPVQQEKKLVSLLYCRTSYVKSVLLYACETWKTTNQITRTLQIFVNKCLRRIMNIKWTNKITNEEVWRITQRKSIENHIKEEIWIGLDTHYIKEQEQ